MKKILNGILALIMIVGLVGCSSTPAKETNTAEQSETTEQTAEPTPSETVIDIDTYTCVSVRITDNDYSEFNLADSVYNKLSNSTIQISEDKTQLPL
jgi:PBP1b-binding outer membrane lipoprotein LpoB